MGIWKPSRKLVADLQASGVRARAEVVKIARGGATSGASSGGGDGPERLDPIDATSRLRTTIRFPGPGGERTEVKTRLTFRIGGIPAVGDSVPVIYDPTDPENVEVDDATHLAELSARLGAPEVSGPTGNLAREVGPIAGAAAPAWGAMAVDARAQVDAARNAQLEQMAELHRQGVLDDAQYEAIRKQISGR